MGVGGCGHLSISRKLIALLKSEHYCGRKTDTCRGRAKGTEALDNDLGGG